MKFPCAIASTSAALVAARARGAPAGAPGRRWCRRRTGTARGRRRRRDPSRCRSAARCRRAGRCDRCGRRRSPASRRALAASTVPRTQPGTSIQASNAAPITAPRCDQLADLLVGELAVVRRPARGSSSGWPRPARGSGRARRGSCRRTGAWRRG